MQWVNTLRLFIFDDAFQMDSTQNRLSDIQHRNSISCCVQHDICTTFGSSAPLPMRPL